MFSLRLSDEHLLQFHEREAVLLTTLAGFRAASIAPAEDGVPELNPTEFWDYLTSDDISTHLVISNCENIASYINAVQVEIRSDWILLY